MENKKLKELYSIYWKIKYEIEIFDISHWDTKILKQKIFECEKIFNEIKDIKKDGSIYYHPNKQQA